jgi:hypothetical protein
MVVGRGERIRNRGSFENGPQPSCVRKLRFGLVAMKGTAPSPVATTVSEEVALQSLTTVEAPV